MALPWSFGPGGVSWLMGGDESMQAIMELFAGLGGWNWLILAVILVVLEGVVPGIHFIWFGMAATLVGAIALATGIDWQWQLLIFGILSLVTAFMVRKYATPHNTPSDQPGLNERGSYYEGRIVVVENAIQNGRGRVRLGDTLWSAQGPDMAVGAKAKVTKLDGTVLIVEAADGTEKFDF